MCEYYVQFFFPMYGDRHFYVICMDMKKCQMLVIDNANYSAEEGGEEKYGIIPTMLVSISI